MRRRRRRPAGSIDGDKGDRRRGRLFAMLAIKDEMPPYQTSLAWLPVRSIVFIHKVNASREQTRFCLSRSHRDVTCDYIVDRGDMRPSCLHINHIKVNYTRPEPMQFPRASHLSLAINFTMEVIWAQATSEISVLPND